MNFGDLHPFFVHFPIAFFILILIIEIMRLFTSRIHSIVSLTILFLGTTLAFLAVQSGESESSDVQLSLTESEAKVLASMDPTGEGSLEDKHLKRTEILNNKIQAHEKAGNLVMWLSIIIFFIWLFLYLKSKDSKNYKYFKIILISILTFCVLQ